MHQGSVDEAVFDRAMTLLVAAVSDPDVLDRCATEDVRHCLAMNLVSSFASLLKGILNEALFLPNFS